MNNLANIVTKEEIDASASWLSEALRQAWAFITNPANIQLLVGIVLIVIVVSLVMKGSKHILDVAVSLIALMFGVHFACQYLGIDINFVEIFRQFVEFLKLVFSGAAA